MLSKTTTTEDPMKEVRTYELEVEYRDVKWVGSRRVFGERAYFTVLHVDIRGDQILEIVADKVLQQTRPWAGITNIISTQELER